jgi:hypothetical protein
VSKHLYFGFPLYVAGLKSVNKPSLELEDEREIKKERFRQVDIVIVN